MKPNIKAGAATELKWEEGRRKDEKERITKTKVKAKMGIRLIRKKERRGNGREKPISQETQDVTRYKLEVEPRLWEEHSW